MKLTEYPLKYNPKNMEKIKNKSHVQWVWNQLLRCLHNNMPNSAFWRHVLSSKCLILDRFIHSLSTALCHYNSLWINCQTLPHGESRAPLFLSTENRSNHRSTIMLNRISASPSSYLICLTHWLIRFLLLEGMS